ncbi:MAG: hypothetical protein NT096_10775 [Proteobacteria bacterium]|nr:hypothetical protein [Pseudomonadota bacterium]
MKQVRTFMVLCAAILFFSPSLWAEMQMGGMEMGKEKKEPSKMVMTPKTAFVKEVLIEGVKAKFEVMTMAEHKKMMEDMKMEMEMGDKSATHHIAVTFYDEKTGKETGNAQVKMKVVSPGKKDQIKMLTYMPEMKHYGNDFTLSEKERYEIMILFKIGDKERKGGIYYDAQ